MMKGYDILGHLLQLIDDMLVNAGCAALVAAGDGVNKLPDWMRRFYIRITMHLRSSGLS